MFEGNSIIKASAGTGKTFALATRYIRLMLLDGEKPETIVALTFSRAAAQEIYTKILERLCRAAQSEEGAAAEWANLLDDFKENRVPRGAEKYAKILAHPPAHTADTFRRLLRKLVDTQHLGAIATLDSFILRIVRNFPKEMGFQNAVSVLDPVDESAAVDDAVRAALAHTDNSTQAVAEAFARVQGGDHPRQCLSAIGNILAGQGWRNFVIAYPACANWTVASMCAALDVPLESHCPDLSGIPVNELKRKNALAPEAAFIQQVRAYDGSTKPFFVEKENLVSQLARFFWENPTAEEFRYTYYKKEYVLRCGAEGAARLQEAVRHVINLYLRRQVEIVRAKIDLVLAVEGEYGRMTRRMGKLTFNDFTKFSAEEEFSARGIAIKNVEFRFDSKFNHWALDEFQDTSELQWRCLKELVQNAAEEGANDEGRSAMAVGDMKQSIYTWRGASAQPFEDIAGWAAFAGCARDFRESHRYGPKIADFVNRVFGHANIKTGGIIPEVCAGAVGAWRNGWIDHVSHEAQDYVKVVEAAPDGDDEEDDEILPTLYREVADLWARHEAERSTETVGVLVRNNANGLKVAEYLRAKELPVVWEGMSPVGDVPVVQAVLALLKLADHPSDTAAWKTVETLIAIRPILLPECPDAASTSRAVSRLLARQGLARTLKGFCGDLRASGRLAADGLTGDKLCQLVESGVAFEGRTSGDGSVDAFLSFVGQSSRRELAASAEVIRVLTIHRSKGLGIDHVFVPLFEGKRSTSAIDAPKGTSPLFDGGDWVLSHLLKGIEQFNARTRAAYARMRSERFAEALRTYYVALTRAKKSMFVIFPAEEGGQPEPEKGLLMRDLIRTAVGGAVPFEAGEVPTFRRRREEVSAAGHEPWPACGMRETVERVSPSRQLNRDLRQLSAGALFEADAGAAARQGVEIHAAYRSLEWAEGEVAARLPADFRAAFVKPAEDAELWRERRYELFDGTRWETGQFDRVVFTGTGAARRAVVYDFKTNTRREDETVEAFAARMRRTYAGQMAAYRHAVSVLTGLSPDAVETVLLLEATGQAARLVFGQ